MIKKIKIQEQSKLDRKLISSLGNSIYNCLDVSLVQMKIKFKDGSSVGFFRSEEDDTVEELLGKVSEKEKSK